MSLHVTFLGQIVDEKTERHAVVQEAKIGPKVDNRKPVLVNIAGGIEIIGTSIKNVAREIEVIRSDRQCVGNLAGGSHFRRPVQRTSREIYVCLEISEARIRAKRQVRGLSV